MKTVIRIVLAAVCLALALMAQHMNIFGCGSFSIKQDCQDCCVANQQDYFKACQGAGGDSQACQKATSDSFNACMEACKNLPNGTSQGVPGSNPQGNGK